MLFSTTMKIFERHRVINWIACFIFSFCGSALYMNIHDSSILSNSIKNFKETFVNRSQNSLSRYVQIPSHLYSRKLLCDDLLLKGSREKYCPSDEKLSKKNCPNNLKDRWKPAGCDMHKYNLIDTRRCLTNFVLPSNTRKEIMFLGDSRLRIVFSAWRDIMQNRKQPAERELMNYNYIDSSTKWKLNFVVQLYNNQQLLDKLSKIEQSENKPYLLLIGNTLHTIVRSKGTLTGQRDFRKYLQLMVPKLETLSKSMIVIWMLQQPVNDRLRTWNGHMTNKAVALYNKISLEVLKPTNITLMYSIRDLGFSALDNYVDSTHFKLQNNHVFIQILTNMICNKKNELLRRKYMLWGMKIQV